MNSKYFCNIALLLMLIATVATVIATVATDAKQTCCNYNGIRCYDNNTCEVTKSNKSPSNNNKNGVRNECMQPCTLPGNISSRKLFLG